MQEVNEQVVEKEEQQLEELRAEEQQEEEDRKAVLKDCAQAWNVFIQGLLKAHHGWENYRKLFLVNRIGIEEFPLEIQKVIYKANPHGDFDLLVEDLVTQPPVKDFLKNQLIKF